MTMLLKHTQKEQKKAEKMLIGSTVEIKKENGEEILYLAGTPLPKYLRIGSENREEDDTDLFFNTHIAPNIELSPTRYLIDRVSLCSELTELEGVTNIFYDLELYSKGTKVTRLEFVSDYFEVADSKVSIEFELCGHKIRFHDQDTLSFEELK